MTDWREKFANEMGLPLSARFQHAEEEIREAAAQIKLQHPTHTPDMARGRAMARLDARKHQRSQAKSFIVTKDHNWRRKVEVAAFILMFLFCLVMATRAHGQSTTIQGRAKGTTSANTATVTANDANHNGMDVNVLNAGSGGTASSFGAAFPATGTAAGFSDGVNMLPATLDASGFLKINCAAGCVAGGSFADSSAFTFGTTTVGNMSAVVDDVATNTVAENSAGAVRMNANRILYMDISKTAANTIAIKVDGSAVTQPVSLTSTTITGTVAVTQSTSPWVISFTAPQHFIIDSGTTAATQSGTWNIRIQDGAGNALTTNSTTYTAKFALDGNLLGTLGTAFTTPGFIDIKGADGNVFVRNATAANFKIDLSGSAANATAGLISMKIDQTTPGTTNGVQVNAALPAGSNIIGNFRIDQTTPGTTNGVRTDASGATGSAPPARAEYTGFLGSGATGGLLAGAPVGDTYKNINISTATTTLLITGVAGRQVRITNMHMLTAAANNVALIEGTGATCGTGTAGMAGGTTAASGYNFAANGGITNVQMQTATAGDSVCAVTSGAGQLSGGIMYAIY